MPITTRIEGEKIIVEIDVNDAAMRGAVMSKSGKSKIIASTGGFVSILTKRGAVALSLNLISKE